MGLLFQHAPVRIHGCPVRRRAGPVTVTTLISKAQAGQRFLRRVASGSPHWVWCWSEMGELMPPMPLMPKKEKPDDQCFCHMFTSDIWMSWSVCRCLHITLVGGLEHDFYFPIYLECHHPNWRTHIFQRVCFTTNQNVSSLQDESFFKVAADRAVDAESGRRPISRVGEMVTLKMVVVIGLVVGRCANKNLELCGNKLEIILY